MEAVGLPQAKPPALAVFVFQPVRVPVSKLGLTQAMAK
jgi:hypothetical protein